MIQDKKRLINFIIFYIGWYICVSQHNITAGIVGMLLALINIWLAYQKIYQIYSIAFLAAIGLLSDWLAHYLQIYQFTYTLEFFSVQNIWLLSLWLLFLSTFNSSLTFLKRFNLWILMLAGMFGGALSYYLANQLNAISFSNTNIALIYLAINWALLFPALFKLYNLWTR